MLLIYRSKSRISKMAVAATALRKPVGDRYAYFNEYPKHHWALALGRFKVWINDIKPRLPEANAYGS